MVELRKRKAPAPPPVQEKKSKPGPKPKATKNVDTPAPADNAPKVPQAGDVIDLEAFGGDLETNEGTATSLKKLVDDSEAGVVIFTYPKASTPGCMSSIYHAVVASAFRLRHQA